MKLIQMRITLQVCAVDDLKRPVVTSLSSYILAVDIILLCIAFIHRPLGCYCSGDFDQASVPQGTIKGLDVHQEL